MSTSVESQRLISLSLGKIAQSRGQRGGINLHKNLLVATVLHKARAAYMIENYNYQCQQQRSQEQQQQQQCEVSSNKDLSCNEGPESVCQQTQQQQPSTPDLVMDQEVGQPTTPNTRGEDGGENRSTVSVSAAEESQAGGDKENFAPAEASSTPVAPAEGNDFSGHLAAAAQLAQDAMVSDGNSKQQTSGAPTCNGILKRRRDNPNTCLVEDSPAVKKAKVIVCDGTVTSPPAQQRSPSYPCQFTVLNADNSSDESSDSESDSEVAMMHTTDSPQISNLVNIFNSGFAGLCASNKASDQDSFKSLSSTLRPDSPTPSATFSRKLSEPSLMCSSEVGRMGSLPSAIVLSA